MFASRTFPACKFLYDAIMSQSDTEDNSLLYCISLFLIITSKKQVVILLPFSFWEV